MSSQVGKHFSATLPELQLFWDSTSLRSLLRCPREYYYRIIRGMVTRHAKLDLEFGIAYHAALEAGDHVRAAGGSVPEQIHESATRALARDEFENYTKEKNRFTLVRSVIWYYAQPRLPKIVMLNGKPLIEASFRFALDQVASTGENFGMCGHLDGVVEEPEGLIYVNERKTTKSYLSSQYWEGFSPDAQISTYALASRIVFPFDVRGVIVDAVSTTENYSDFASMPINRSQDVLEEFQHDLAIALRLADQYAQARYWPKNEANCRLCPFKKVCSAAPVIREEQLNAEFIHQPWNPLVER